MGGKWKYIVLLLLTMLVSYFVGGLIKTFLSIGTIALTCCLFLLLKDVRIDVNSKLYALVKHISALSFGIYLCHMLVLKVFMENIYVHLSASWYYQVIAMFLTFGGAYVMSWLLSMLPFKKYIIG